MLQCLMHFGYAGSSSHEPDRFPRCCQRGTENSDWEHFIGKRNLAPGSLASTATQCRVSPPDAGDVGGVPVFHLSRSRPY